MLVKMMKVVLVWMAGAQAVPTDVGGWSPIIGPNHQTLATTSRSVRCDVMCCRTVQDIVFPGYITRYDGRIIIIITIISIVLGHVYCINLVLY